MWAKSKLGKKLPLTVDAFAGQTFEGEVRQVRKAAQTVANVVTYVAVIGFSNSGGRLLPGMTANVRVITDALCENVLKVPNAALRMKIAGVEPAATGAAPAATGNPRLLAHPQQDNLVTQGTGLGFLKRCATRTWRCRWRICSTA